jgi:hypothetical protein
MTLDELSGRLVGVRRTGRGVSARCPAHDDRQNSLSVATGDDGRVLLHDFAGCSTEAILAALNLTWADLFADSKPVTERLRVPPIVCELDKVRVDLVARERRMAERRAQWSDVWSLADEARHLDRLIARARAVITEMGDCDEAWTLEAQVSALEVEMWNAETQAHVAVVGRRLW